MLPLSGAITDFALATDAKGVFQGVMRLALVQADLGTMLHVGVQQPINNDERALDAADFAQGQSEVMLARIGREFAQKLAGRYRAQSLGAIDARLNRLSRQTRRLEGLCRCHERHDV